MFAPAVTRLPTGFAALDHLLGGGWPRGLLTELLVSGHGSSEFGLLSPALARLTTLSQPPSQAQSTHLAAGGWVLLIAPPWIPYGPGLCWQGFALNRVLMVSVGQPLEALWAMEEALRSGSCTSVIAWVGARATERAGHSLLQRLHLLAGRQQAWAVLIREARFRRERSPVRLRLELRCPSPATLQIEIFKNGWRGAGTVTVERRF